MIEKKNKIEVSFTPANLDYYEFSKNVVVVIDILRASSAICTALEYGVKKIIPVETVEEAREYQKKGYICAAERKGKIVDGFTLGNSPFNFMNKKFKNKTIILTTTNGTQAIRKAKNARKIAVGSFLNLNAVAEWLINENANSLLLCAGWKNRFNLEDALFAGALAKKLIDSGNFFTQCDSTIASMHLYDKAKKNLNKFLENSSHRIRLKNLNLEKDIDFCLTLNAFNNVPEYIKGAIRIKNNFSPNQIYSKLLQNNS